MNNIFNLKNKLSSNKGMTLIEVVVSITILGIVVVPLLSVFSTSMTLASKRSNQIEINSITRLIKDNVMVAIKNNRKIKFYNDDGTIGEGFLKESSGFNNYQNVVIEGKDGNVYTDKFKFDITHQPKFSSNAYQLSIAEYLVVIKKMDNKEINRFVIVIDF